MLRKLGAFLLQISSKGPLSHHAPKLGLCYIIVLMCINNTYTLNRCIKS